ncbi:glutaredoxin 2 [Roseibium hamelinense]|uniref:Glutaredoxin 2 n=1 Tax=Roseibium hamelinense TaxID=150831 RepID=A0A562T263_9HYPH|nr:glutaredoxin 2 [Roseibium hamelinense]MTI44475.1 glutaredoxin 2 [Roseibium hamelinense]TWI87443.1 glutaredoxin 2 [Roseibium hamelinense]
MGDPLKLLMFEHCSLCFRVRMIAALKGIALEEQVVLDDDSNAMISLVGKRVIPILIKEDGKPMLESMDMVEYIEAMGAPLLTGPERPEIATMCDEILSITPYLTMPRYPLLGLPEMATIAAHDHYLVRKLKIYEDFVPLRARTREFLKQLELVLDRLAAEIKSPDAVNGTLSKDDIRLLPLLRSAAVVKGLQYPQKVADYFETMMARTGFKPLPVI